MNAPWYGNQPVRPLKDPFGIYGLSSATECELGADPTRPPLVQKTLILRPDRLGAAVSQYAVLQQITGGFRRGLFKHSVEENLRKELHHELLRRKGLPWPPPQQDRWWSRDKAQQGRNRRIFHGMRLKSLDIINALIRQALEVADPNALKLARRFEFRLRYPLYVATAISPRALQLADAFPALAVAIYTQRYGPRSENFDSSRRNEAAQLVEAGAPLRRVAEALGIPMALRAVKPGAVGLAFRAVELGAHDPRLFHAYLPRSLPQAKLWLLGVCVAGEFGSEFVAWTARNCLQIANEPTALRTILSDIGDWVKAGSPASIEPVTWLGREFRPIGAQFVRRPFSPDMSIKTVTKLSAEWHEAVADNMTGPDHAFPPPWCDAGAAGGYEIVPLVSAAELYLEGRSMHHCAGTYVGDVRDDRCYFFSVRANGARVATLELLHKNGDPSSPNHAFVHVGQLRGPCNAQVSKAVEQAVRTWLRAQTPRLPPPPPRRPPQLPLPPSNDACGDFPF